MALAETLSIYQPARDLLLLVMKLQQNFPRSYRPTMARDVSTEAQAVVIGVFRANSATDKRPHLETLRERLETLKLLLRLSKDLHLISPSQFGATVELTTAIGRQLTGWMNYYKDRA